MKELNKNSKIINLHPLPTHNKLYNQINNKQNLAHNIHILKPIAYDVKAATYIFNHLIVQNTDLSKTNF
jgi:hypothetical protein